MSAEPAESGHASEQEIRELPFKVTVQSHAAPVPEEESDEFADSMSLEEIEAAYLRALETADLADALTMSDDIELSEPSDSESDLEPKAELPSARAETSAFDAKSDLSQRIADAPGPAQEIDTPVAAESIVSSSEEPGTFAPSGETDCQQPPSETPAAEEPDAAVISAEQVVEALLFVGGAPLPTKKFLDILGGMHTPEQVSELLDSINLRYIAQRRPYEIRLLEGGYQLQLSASYESVRGRAYGQGPKEVKLTQDAIEVLAFIAYQQPVGRAAIEETGKLNVPGLVRQLLRRELVCVDRTDTEAGEQYRTTNRFLELFGLASLEDLPQAGTFNFK